MRLVSRWRARGGASPSLRRIALGVAIVVAAETAVVSLETGMAFAAAPARATTTAPPAAKPQPQAASSAETVAAAMVMARVQKRKIEAISERTEASTTYALPNGQLETTSYAAPIRVKRGDGRWADIDTTLADQGAALQPGVATADISVSDGGDTALASVSKNGKSFRMGWDKTLPAPRVEHDTASYDLGGGQTLTVTALADGFSQNVLLTKAPKTPVSYRIPLKLSGLKLSEAKSGRLLLTDTRGKLVAEAPAPMMWDSSKDKRSGESKNIAPVDTEIETAADGTQTLVLTPDADYFAKDLTYPVTVDPTSTLAVQTDTWVATNYPDSQVSSSELKSGTYDAGATIARSYLKFDTTPFKGKHVTDTNLSLYSYYASTCSTTGSGTQVRRITADWSSSTVTWGAQPATTTTGAVTNTAALGYNSTCPAGTMNFDIDAIVQAWAAGSADYGLQVRGVTETDSLTWRRFRSANYISGDAAEEPHLTVTYNSYPAVPSGAAIAPSAVNAYNGKRYVTSLTPTLTAKVSDPDGSSTKGQFEITPDPAYNDTTYTYTGTTASVASGSTAQLTIPSANAFPAGMHLRYRVRAYDGTDYGSWTGYSAFVLNTAKPAAPTISCDAYAANTWTPKAASATCTLDTSSTDGAGYHWGLDDSTVPNKKLDTVDGTGGDAQTITISPADGWHTLYARAVDSGGNLSTTTTAYSFGVGADGAAITAPADGADTARRLTLAAKGKSTYTGVTWQYRRGETDAWKTVPVANVTASGNPVSAWPVAVSGGTATTLVWDVVSTLTEDGVIELRAAFTDGTTTGYSQTVEATLDRDAGTAPTTEIGPGSVNLLTGDYTLTESDTTAFEASVSRVSSSRARDAEQEGQAEIFGPGWVSSVVADANDTEFTEIRKTSGTSVELLTADGDSIAFTGTTSGGWAPQTGHEALTLTGSLTGTSFTLKDSAGSTTVFAKAGASATTWTFASSAASVDDSTVTIASETVTVGGAVLARPRYVVSPVESVSAATCQATPSTRGCRVLEFVYATSTTASGSVFGDFTGQVKAVKLWATSPGAAAATAETVVSYAYDSTGHLREVWDPRISPALKRTYTYDAADRVATLAEPGKLPWTFTYGQAGSALTAGEGMLLKASRPALAAGSDTQISGTAATSVVYDVPRSGSAAPYQMTGSAVAAWGQSGAPTDATAVFPADSVPPSHTGADLASTAYARANISYIDANGDEVNMAAPGGGIHTVEYDVYGNAVGELTPANRELALGTSADAADTLAVLGIADLSTAERAELLSTVSVHSADGQQLREDFGPLHVVTLASSLAGATAEATLPAGTAIPARAHNVYTYDENRPANATVSNLLTSTRTGAFVEGYPSDADVRTRTTGYDWTNGQALNDTDDPSGAPVTTRTTYDSRDRVATTRTARSTGTDAGTTVYTYYTADGTGTCAGRPEWAGMLCRTAPAAAISGGGTNPTEAVTTVHTYDRWGQTATKAETANGVTRTTTYTTDAGGRTTRTAITGGSGDATPDTTLTYDAENGQVSTQSSNARTITYGYDDLGRVTSYNDGAGNTATTEYDILGRPVKQTDSVPSTKTFAYNTAGLPSTLTDSVAGTITATYDAEGNLLTETLPGNHKLTVTTDSAGNTTGKVYTTQDGTTVLSDVAGFTVHEQQAGHTQTDGGTTRSEYTYDGASRLVKGYDETANGCTTRDYTLDAAGNRSKLVTSSDDCDSATADVTTGTVTHTYDTADRLTDAGHVYDAFGRTTSDGATSLTYYTNDLVRSETKGDNQNIWSLDAAGRLAEVAAQTKGTDGVWATSSTTVNHYAGGTDSPSWTRTSADVVSRTVADMTGLLAATTASSGEVVLQLSNLHGDVSVQLPLDVTQPMTVQHTDEFGNELAGTASSTYGWLGAYQRDGATLGGYLLMGVRLYDPSTGRFLQTDPVLGGNDNPYIYPADPVNMLDLDGKKKKPRKCGFWCERAFDALDWVLGKVVCKMTGWGVVLCAGMVSGFIAVVKYAYQCYKRCWSTRTAGKKFAWGFVAGAIPEGAFKAMRKYKRKIFRFLHRARPYIVQYFGRGVYNGVRQAVRWATS